MALKRAVGFCFGRSERPERFLSSESVEGTSLTLECVDDVHSGDGLSLGVLAVGDGVTDDVLKEDLEDSAGLLVDEAGDALHTTTTSETADGGLGDALDVVTQHLPVTLGASLSESLASLSTSRHDCTLDCSSEMVCSLSLSHLYTHSTRAALARTHDSAHFSTLSLTFGGKI